MKITNLYLSTTASDGAEVAKQYGLGLELAEYCTAWNLDQKFSETDSAVREKLRGVDRCLLHGPFNELFPCAIDPRARELAVFRYRQAVKMAKYYGAEKVILHGGYQPRMYYPVWYVEQSVAFWIDFFQEDPGVELVLENVLEETPDMLLEIVRRVDHPGLGLCLDVGHVHVYSRVPVVEWVKTWSAHIRHFHLHNNDTSWDTHNPLNCGTIPMIEVLELAQSLCPEASRTLEVMEAKSSMDWLSENFEL